jgi:Brp/Blh family beta-carotene 15,15'-monooxygenase
MPRYAHALAKYPEVLQDWTTLHAAAALALALSAGAGLGNCLPVFGRVVVFAVLTAVVGIPHGGLDHRFGRAVCSPWVGKWWSVAFPLTYLSVALLVLAGWVMVPLTMIMSFFLWASFHFGEGGWSPMAAVEGAMVIWIPFLARPEDASSLLAMVIPGPMSGSVQNILSRVTPLLWALAFLFAAHLITMVWVGIRDRETRTFLKACRLTAFAVLFATAPVLIGFVTFFCGWHSTRELVDLARRMDPSRPSRGLSRVILLSAPLSILVVVATRLGAWWRFADGHSLQLVVVQGTFLALSAVAVPHILSHKIADRLGVDPFSAAAQSLESTSETSPRRARIFGPNYAATPRAAGIPR